jgi:hypothetical protein
MARAGTAVSPSVYSSDNGTEGAPSLVSDVDSYVIIIKFYIVFSTYFWYPYVGKLKVNLIKHYVKKTCGGVEV